MKSLLRVVVLALACPTVALAQTKDHAPTSLEASRQMSQDKPGSESWTYIKPDLSLKHYDSVRIVPTAVYTGPDAQFDNISLNERQKFADVMTDALKLEMGKFFQVVAQAGSSTVAVKVTLLGAEKTTGGVATASRVTPFGLAANAVKSLADKPGTLSGSLLVAVEVTDSRSGELLAAAVRRRSPDALDIPATLSTADTMMAVARDFAETLRKKLIKANLRQHQK